MSAGKPFRTLLVNVPADLHPDTAELVITFAGALAGKLNLSEVKHGFQNEWKTMDWRDECLRQLILHVHKGDPLDVAAYAAFAWARGWLTTDAMGCHVSRMQALLDAIRDGGLPPEEDKDTRL